MITTEQRAGAFAELARRELLFYCALMDPGYLVAKHSKLLIECLEALERRELRRLMVFEPPRHSKTYHVSERFPAWYLGRRPGDRVILASYAAELAERNSRVVRGLVTDERAPFAVRVAMDSRAVGRWDTDKGGGVLAAGVGGGITGFGADLLCIDDPIKGREEADSDTYRERTWEWYQEVARTRLMPDAVELLTMTRWHEDDLAGRILNTEGASDWTILSLPAVAEADDILGRPIGEALWPDRFPIEALPSVTKGEISSRAFAALYQQRPVAEAGGMIKAAWLQRKYDVVPDQGERWVVVQAVDTAYREGVANDFSAIGTWATDGISYYLLDQWRGRVDYPTLRATAQERYFKWLPRVVLIEDAVNGVPLIQDLQRNTPIPVVAVKPRGSKESRVEAVTPLFESGHVVLPRSAPWLEEWVHEHLAFPQAAHDDQVDTSAMCLAALRERFTPSVVQLHTTEEEARRAPRGLVEKIAAHRALRERQVAGGSRVRRV